MMHERVTTLVIFPAIIIKYAYNNIAAGSNLRTYFDEVFKRNLWLEQIIPSPMNQTQEFLCDILPFVARRSGTDCYNSDQVRRFDRCQWHDHSGPGGKLRLEARK